jgi:ABC-type multidrug transport system permease subunit
VLAVALLLACGVLGPIGLFLMLFTAVYTLVLYTLTYRGAAQLVGPEAKA